MEKDYLKSMQSGPIQTLGDAVEHLFAVKALNPALQKEVLALVTNDLASSIHDVGSKFDETKGEQIYQDKRLNETVTVVASNQNGLLVTPTTTMQEIKATHGTGTKVVVGFDDFTVKRHKVIADRVRMAFLSSLKVTSLDRSVAFNVEASKSKATFNLTMTVKGNKIATIKGYFTYQLKDGRVKTKAGIAPSIVPQYVMVVDSFEGPQNQTMLNYMVAYLSGAFTKEAIEPILSSAPQMKYLLSLFNKIEGVNLSLSDADGLKKMVAQDTVIITRLPQRVSPQDNVVVNGTVDNQELKVLKNDILLDKDNALMMPANNEQAAFENFINYKNNLEHIAFGFLYVKEFSSTALKSTFNQINQQTGAITNTTDLSWYGIQGPTKVVIGEGVAAGTGNMDTAAMLEMMKRAMGGL